MPASEGMAGTMLADRVGRLQVGHGAPSLGNAHQYYLTRLADVMGIDIPCAVKSMLAVNQAKYPPEKVRGRSDKYDTYDR